MFLSAVATAAICLWIVLWSIGVKAIDGFLLVLLILLVAAGLKVLMAYLPTQRQ